MASQMYIHTCGCGRNHCSKLNSEVLPRLRTARKIVYSLILMPTPGHATPRQDLSTHVQRSARLHTRLRGPISSRSPTLPELSTSPHLCTRRLVGAHYLPTYLPTYIQMSSHFQVCMYVLTQRLANLYAKRGVCVCSKHTSASLRGVYIHEASVHEMCKGCGDAHRLRANRVLRFPPRLIAEECVCMYVRTYMHVLYRGILG